MRALTTIQKVSLGFTLLTLLLVAAVGFTIWQVSQTQAVTDQLVKESGPMTDASLRIINGLNYSVSQLRGWMLINDDSFKTDRGKAWSEWITPALAKIKDLTAKTGTPAQQSDISSVDENLKRISDLQLEAEAIARTDKNLPAHDLHHTQAAPKELEVMEAITSMIDVESRQEATPERKQLLFQLANVRATLARAGVSIRDTLISGSEQDGQEYQQIWQQNSQATDRVDADISLLDEEQVQTWTQVKRNLNQLETLYSRIVEIRLSDRWNLAVAMVRDRGTPQARQVRDTLQKFIAELKSKNDENGGVLVSKTAFLKAMEWVLLAIGIILSIVLGIAIVRSVKQALSVVTASVQEVRTSSNEIAAGSQQQVASLNQTAASLNEITATAEEFKATMQEFADRARAVQEAAKETTRQSAEGRTLTQDSATRIEQVRNNSRAAGESVLKLAEQMQRIGEITATVNEIAEQTKLLALNASIEAARAGEEGRGFAVVATQVRELANQSKDAAGRIESLISNTHKSMQEVVGKIEDGNRLSEESTHIVRRMTQTFEEIAQAIEQTTSAMAQINTGARQQEQGISQLVSSITEIDSASKESLASAEQTQKAILAIDSEIKRLSDTMATF